MKPMSMAVQVITGPMGWAPQLFRKEGLIMNGKGESVHQPVTHKGMA